ncbi:VanZ family protein [Enterococcus eurekensis]|uniref:VanZ family protein n=1 Tax=Enterococcus eurekensis TaxID=1159753 RepID=A0ABV9M2D6_9ENTE
MIQSKKQTRWMLGLFLIYFVVIIWVIIFKMSFSIHELTQLRSINLIPYGDSAIVNQQVDFSEIYMNILAFVPFGIYLAMLKPNSAIVKLVAIVGFTSLSIEVIQYLFTIGASDITDLIGNTFGGLLGILFDRVSVKILKSRQKTNKIFNILATIATASFLILVALIFMAN